MGRIGFRFEGGGAWGLGHVYRCRNLIAQLLKEGVECIVFSHFNEAIKTVFREIECEKIDLKSKNQEEEKKEMVVLLLQKKISTLVLDILDTTADYVSELKKYAYIVGIDDCGEGGQLLNRRINAIVLPAAEKVRDEADFIGDKYIVLNENVLNYASCEKEISPGISELLLSFGGSDPLNLTQKMLEVLSGSKWNLTVVAGSAYENFDYLKKYEAERCRVLKNVNNLPELIFKSDLCFISGGITLYEVMAIGTPCCVICQVPHQLVTASRFEKKGAILSLGLGDKLDFSNMDELIYGIEKDFERRVLRSRKGKEYIDGKGLARVLDIIKGADK